MKPSSLPLPGLATLLLLLFLTGCHTSPPPQAPAEWHAWQQVRLKDIAGTNGWATLAGLHWLTPGANSAGTATTNEVVFPAGRAPAHVGVFLRHGKEVEFHAAPGMAASIDGHLTASVALLNDEHGTPSVLTLGELRMFVVIRGERVGLRVKDSEAPTRRHFQGLDYFPYEPSRRVIAKFIPYTPTKHQSMTDVTGATTEEVCPGALAFTLDGQELRLDTLIDKESGDYFLLFRDGTSGKTTYGSGRYMHTKPADASGKVVLDFNYAYNPPCAFTSFATCQLPPRQNWLPLPIIAGERRYAGGH